MSSAYLPISAVVVPEFLYEPMVAASGEVGLFGHGFTYSGHPVAASVALRALHIYEERKLYEAERLAAAVAADHAGPRQDVRLRVVEAVDVVAPLGEDRPRRVVGRLLVRVVEDLEPDAGEHRDVVRLEVRSMITSTRDERRFDNR